MDGKVGDGHFALFEEFLNRCIEGIRANMALSFTASAFREYILFAVATSL
jgi:hypothetical protein